MATITYTWNVDSVDPAASSIVVTYIYNNMVIRLNLPSAPAGTELEEHIAKFAPLEIWKRIMTPQEEVEPGTGGSVEVEIPVDPTPVDPPAGETQAL